MPAKAAAARPCGSPASNQGRYSGTCRGQAAGKRSRTKHLCPGVNRGKHSHGSRTESPRGCNCAPPTDWKATRELWPSNPSSASNPTNPSAPYRTAPHNIEAEQSLLGAILVNNEALYRVSDFLEPEHFFEPIHQQIYDIARSLIRTGKLASPVTLKTFVPADARHRRHDGRAISRPPRGRSDHHHQRGRTTAARSTISRSGAS